MANSEQTRGEKQESMQNPLGTWMQMTFDYWQTVSQMHTEMMAPSADAKPQKHDGLKGPSGKMLRSGINWFKILQTALESDEGVGAIAKSTETIPSLLMTVAQQAWESFVQIQQHAAKRVAVVGRKSEPFDFSDLNENVFAAWREIYEKELQKFLKVPQLGLMRFYQERMGQYTDKTHLYQNAATEFAYTLMNPVRKSIEVMQDKVDEMVRDKKVPEDPNALYSIWVKTLEGHYMVLLQSPEYLESFQRLMSTLTEYHQAKDQIVRDLLQSLPVPTDVEMDELCKEIYLLKKRVRRLEDRLAEKEA